jgi:hypothetical protein
MTPPDIDAAIAALVDGMRKAVRTHAFVVIAIPKVEPASTSDDDVLVVVSTKKPDVVERLQAATLNIGNSPNWEKQTT